MGYNPTFAIGKSVMKNARLPKICILLQFGERWILALLCPDDSIQTLLILSLMSNIDALIQSVKSIIRSVRSVKLKK